MRTRRDTVTGAGTPGGPRARTRQGTPLAAFGVLVLALLVVALLVVAGAPPAGAARDATMPVPAGWKTYAYADALVSAPADWAVERNAPCPSTRAPGLLVLGVPQGVTYMCPMIVFSANQVELTIAAPPSGVTAPPGAPMRVDGLRVVPVSSGPGGSEWWVPALGLLVTGRGPDAERVLQTLRPLVPRPLTATCQRAALRADMGSVDRQLGVASWPAPTPVRSWSAAVPVPPAGFAATDPQFARLVDTGLEVFATLTGAPGAAAFYSATLDPSRQLTLSSRGCAGAVAGIETLEGTVASRVLGPPWDMVAVTEPGAQNGAVFFRGNCPGGVAPTSTTAPCATVAVYAPTGAPTPGWVTASVTPAG